MKTKLNNNRIMQNALLTLQINNNSNNTQHMYGGISQSVCEEKRRKAL